MVVVGSGNFLYTRTQSQLGEKNITLGHASKISQRQKMYVPRSFVPLALPVYLGPYCCCSSICMMTLGLWVTSSFSASFLPSLKITLLPFKVEQSADVTTRRKKKTEAARRMTNHETDQATKTSFPRSSRSPSLPPYTI